MVELGVGEGWVSVADSGADFFAWRGPDLLANLARRGHCLERGADDLRGTGATRFVGRLGLEQLRVREDNAKLVAQAVQQLAQFD
jgi:hypothetical protein